MINTIKIYLKRGREKSVLRYHPWIFSGAADRVVAESGRESGIAEVFAADGTWLARGTFSPASQICVRLLTFDENEAVAGPFFYDRIADAQRMRAGRFDAATHSAVRLVHGESDGLPGLIADRYGDVISIQILTAGMDLFRAEIADAFAALNPGCAVYERSDTPTRALEGLEPVTGILRGALASERTEIRVNGIRLGVDIAHGHKTGCYLDQVDNWAAVARHARGADVLDTFCYNGGFTLAALANGAKSVTAIDSSRDALDNVSRNIALNGFDAARTQLLCDNVFDALRKFRDSRRTFDLIILDPPKFADSKGAVERACRAYKDINLLAFKLLRPGGTLATFSCSGSVPDELFRKVVADAAVDAARPARMTERFTQAPDHPVALSFPEGFYLKGLLAQC